MAEAADSVKLTALSPIAPSSTTSPSDVTNARQRTRSNSGDAAVDAQTQVSNSHGPQTPQAISSPQPSSTAKALQIDAQRGLGAAIDPISRQILERTKSQQGAPRILPTTSVEASFAPSLESHAVTHAQDGTRPASLRRNESVSSVSKGIKDKKKGVSLFGRFIGTKKKDASGASISERAPTDAASEVFSRPAGLAPQFPALPRYIKVRANNRKQREFERVFLAQVLLERNPRSKKKTLGDEEIVQVDEALTSPGQPLDRAIWAMDFSQDGRYLAAAGQDKKVRIWAVISSTEERAVHEVEEEKRSPEQAGTRLNAPVLGTKLIREYQGHTSSILDLSWSKNNFLLSSSMDKTVRLWHVSRDECLCAFKHHDFVTSIAFHPRDDRFFLAGSLDAKLRLWSIPDKSVAYWVNVPDMVTAVAFTPDGRTCIAGCLNGLCLFYHTDKLKLHSQLHVRSARGRNAKGSKITGIGTITLPPTNPNGDVKLLITSNDSRVRMYNYKDRNLEIKFRGNENTCSQIHATFSDDGRYVICGSEDRKVYIWPTGPIEKQDQHKRPVEILEAHSAIVTSALLAPLKTRQHLAQSGDPVYDLCNPPPVTLSEYDSVISPHTQLDPPRSHTDPAATPVFQHGSGGWRAEETPAYLARHAHHGGNLIVTADYLGQIKIFRQDCAFQRRRSELFDSGSLFSRSRLLRRSGSMTTHTSLSSARNSITYSNSKNPSTDRIITWRNSIMNSTGSNNGATAGGGAIRAFHRARSDSPRKGSAIARSPRHPFRVKPPSFSTNSVPSSHTKSSNESARIPAVESSSIDIDPKAHEPLVPAEPDETVGPSANDSDDVLYLRGDQSYRYWKSEKLAAMAQREPRTPGLLSPGDFKSNPMSRNQSIASRLSSEVNSDETAISEAEGNAGEEIGCKKCGGKNFRVTLGRRYGSEEKRFSCKRCGNVC